MKKVLVGATLAAFAMKDKGYWGSWLDPDFVRSAYAWTHETDIDVEFFGALELDRRGDQPFLPLMRELLDLDGWWWTFSLDDGRHEVTTESRLRHIAMGQNVLAERAVSGGYSHLLLLGADTVPPADVIERLLEVCTREFPVVGAEVPSYGLVGDPVCGMSEYSLTRKLATGCLMIDVNMVFNELGLRWRLVPGSGLSDDFQFQADLLRAGYDQVVREDVVCRHYPEHISPIEHRFTEDERRVH